MPEQSSLFGSDNAPAEKKNIPTPPSSHATVGEPLAARMRPCTLDEIAGQEHLLASGKLLRRLIETDRVTSMILWGPPGSGKTTLADVIARSTHARLITLITVSTIIAVLRRMVKDAMNLRK